MYIKTSELDGAALDWAVAAATKRDTYHSGFRPSSDWSQGGRIVDHYLIEFRTQSKGCKVLAWAAHEPSPSYGENHLVAACRAVVSIELGDTVDVPEELL